jgi:serine/threonine protein kinase
MPSKYCPKCNQTYPVTQRFCRSDQEILSLKDPYHLVGRTLLDKYKITALVGLGGMGAVYHAYHLGIDRRVAFKILQPNLAIGNEYVVELFEREAKLAGRLSHENIVDIKDAGHTPDGIAYIVMEWLEGRTLDEEVSYQGRFDFKRAIGIVRQITDALSEAHAKRVVHRDLKPGNIMLLDRADGRDHVKVLDFGIGKVIEETTADSPVSAMVGTPQYASPEQLTVGSHIDGRSDIYSLGVIFYRLLGGQLPFNCSSMGELLQLQLTATPPPLGEIRPETPLSLENLVKDMLAKEPAERPQSAVEVQTRLAGILEELKIEGPEEEKTRDDVHAAEAASLKPRELDERTTEEFLRIPPPLKPDSGTRLRSPQAIKQIEELETASSISQITKRSNSSLLYGTAIVTIVLAGGYGLYRYRSDATSIPDKQIPIEERTKPSPSPTPVLTKELPPTPSATVIATPENANKQSSTQPQPRPTPAANPGQILAREQKAAEHLRLARELYNRSEYHRALRECNESLRLNPRQSEARELKRKITDIIRILNGR